MAAADTKRKVTTVRGQLDPRLLYDAEGLMRAAGIGRTKLMELRHSGKLRPLRFCGEGRSWYRGEDVIALMEAK
jgi:hypothetical protein